VSGDSPQAAHVFPAFCENHRQAKDPHLSQDGVTFNRINRQAREWARIRLARLCAAISGVSARPSASWADNHDFFVGQLRHIQRFSYGLLI
jgi:hypothetical protein